MVRVFVVTSQIKIEVMAKDMTKGVKPSNMTLKYTKNEQGEYVCPDCGVTKKNQNTMHYHMKKHQEELDHVCTVCHKGFLQKQTLDLHIRSKHPEVLEEEEKKYVCPMDGCSFRAMTKGNFLIHCLRVHFREEIEEMMEHHADTKSYSCTDCDREFFSSCAFYYHCKDCLILDEQDEKHMLFKTMKSAA
jgi:DNA-directed RNA polymerase subunit RPC12/RpoP